MNVALFFELFDRSVSVPLTCALLHFVWQGVVIAGLLLVMNTLLRRESPRLRHGLSVAAMLVMVGCLPANYIWLRSAMGTSDAVFANSAASRFVATIDTAAPTATLTLRGSADAIEVVAASPESSLIEEWAPLAATGYTAGVLLMTLRLVCSTLAVFRLRAFSTTLADSRLTAVLGQLCAEFGVRVPPALSTCEKLAVPAVVGLLKPVILMPPAIATGMSCDELEAVLLHELAHIIRSDLLVNFLQRVAESFLFFHPAVWYVSRLIASHREDCCDDIVLSKCNRRDYASALIRLSEACTGQSSELAPVAALAATGASPSQLKRRVMRILGVGCPLRFERPGFGLMMTFAVALSIPVFDLHAQSEQNDGRVEAKQTGQASEEPVTVEPAGEKTKVPIGGDASFVGPVHIERVGDVLLIRGTNKDVEKVQQMITVIENASHPRSSSSDSNAKPAHGPIQVDQNNVGHLVIRGESEQEVEALEEILREVWADLRGVAQRNTAPQTLRSLRLTEGAKSEMLKVALDAYLEGRGIDDEGIRYQVTTEETKAKLILYCQDVHFQQIAAFLKNRKWITDTESDGDRYWVFYLKHVAAETAVELLRTLFFADTAEADVQLTVDQRLNRILVRASKNVAPQIEAVLKQIDTQPESAAQQLRLAFKQAPWSDVLGWIAEQTKSQINQDHVPRGTFSFEDRSRTYSPVEALDVINEALFSKGYSLIHSNKMIHIVDLNDDSDVRMARDLLGETPLARLDARGDFELTKCRFDAGSKNLARIHADIQPLLGKYGSLVMLPGSKRFLVVDTGRNLRLVRGAIRDHTVIDP